MAVRSTHACTDRHRHLDAETVDRLSAGFHRCFTDFEAGDLFTPHAFYDLLPPMWRFQLQGPGHPSA